MHGTDHGHAKICRGCWDQMHMPIPIRGPLSMPLRVFGITRSKMNPNICTICERAFTAVYRQRHITATATILFADIRGYTSLSERMEPGQLIQMVGAFQDQCALAIWDRDGIVNKQMGDGLMAIFNFPILTENHAEAAIAAARDIQRRCHEALRRFAEGAAEGGIGVGIGIHSGSVEIGEFSNFHAEVTAIGGTVNLASRLETQAAAGEILVSAESAAQAPDLMKDAEMRMLTLKGIEHPVAASVLSAAA